MPISFSSPTRFAGAVPSSRDLSRAGLTIAAAGLLGACASIPRSSIPVANFPSLSCEQLAREREQARQTETLAQAQRRKAWRGVLPVAVVVRYGRAAGIASGARKRGELLDAELAAKQCSTPVDENADATTADAAR